MQEGHCHKIENRTINQMSLAQNDLWPAQTPESCQTKSDWLVSWRALSAREHTIWRRQRWFRDNRWLEVCGDQGRRRVCWSDGPPRRAKSRLNRDSKTEKTVDSQWRRQARDYNHWKANDGPDHSPSGLTHQQSIPIWPQCCLTKKEPIWDREMLSRQLRHATRRLVTRKGYYIRLHNPDGLRQ